MCTEACEPKCVCDEGFIRDMSNYQCIPVDDCKDSICGPNEQYHEQGSRCWEQFCCENGVASTEHGTTMNCNPHCDGTDDLSEVCICKPGFIRLPDGRCTTFDECTTGMNSQCG